MRTTLRVMALLLTLITLSMWLFGGGNRGWTKTSVMLKTTDPVTTLDVIKWKQRFIPGLDFLVGGVSVGLILLGASYGFSRPRHNESC